jgi:hypothetical protein
MLRTHDDEEDWDSDGDASDSADDEDEDTTVPCPHCRKHIHEDAVRCPYCENYISREDELGHRRSKWFYVVLALCLVIAVGWALMWW